MEKQPLASKTMHIELKSNVASMHHLASLFLDKVNLGRDLLRRPVGNFHPHTGCS